jgi:hypothetical protein
MAENPGHQSRHQQVDAFLDKSKVKIIFIFLVLKGLSHKVDSSFDDKNRKI